MTAAILSIGTELTRGEITNTNAAWLAAELVGLGFEIVEHCTVDDDRARIIDAMPPPPPPPPPRRPRGGGRRPRRGGRAPRRGGGRPGGPPPPAGPPPPGGDPPPRGAA